MSVAIPVDFAPQAPIELRKPSGRIIAFGKGSQTDAARGTAIIAAKDAAESGDTISVWASASSIAEELVKDGVNWHFGRVTISAASGIYLWLTPDEGSATCRVTGDADFVGTGDHVCVCPVHADDDYFIECNSITANGSGGNCIWQYDGTLNLIVKGDLVSNNHDVCTIDGGDATIRVLGRAYTPETSTDNVFILNGGTSKIYFESAVSGNATAFRIEGGTHYLNGREIGTPDTGVPPESAITISEAVGEATVIVDIRDIKGRITHTAGDVEIRNSKLDTTYSASAASLTVGASGVVLNNVEIVTHGSQTNSITAGSSQTVGVVGTLKYNKALNNITLSYGGTAGNAIQLASTTPGATGLALLDDASASAGRDTLGATSGVWSVAAGGTGAGTLTGLVKGNGTSAMTAASQGTDYYAPSGTDVAIADGGTGGSTTSAARANLGVTRQLANYITDSPNSGTSETDLFTTTLAAGQLANNGDMIRASWVVDVAPSAGTETLTVKVYFAGTALYTVAQPEAGYIFGNAARFELEVIRVSSSVVRYLVKDIATSGLVTYGELTSLTLANTQIVKITGQASSTGAGSGDIVGKFGSVDYIPAAGTP